MAQNSDKHDSIESPSRSNFWNGYNDTLLSLKASTVCLSTHSLDARVMALEALPLSSPPSRSQDNAHLPSRMSSVEAEEEEELEEEVFVLDVEVDPKSPFKPETVGEWTKAQQAIVEEDISTRSPPTHEELRQLVGYLSILTRYRCCSRC